MVLRQVCLCHYPQETEHRGWCCTEWSLLIRSILSLTQSCKPSHHGRLCHSADRSQHVSQSVFVYSPEFMSKSQSSVMPQFSFFKFGQHMHVFSYVSWASELSDVLQSACAPFILLYREFQGWALSYLHTCKRQVARGIVLLVCCGHVVTATVVDCGCVCPAIFLVLMRNSSGHK